MMQLDHLECVLRFARGFFEQLADSGFLQETHGDIPSLQFCKFLLKHSQKDRNDYIKYGKWWSSSLLAHLLLKKRFPQEVEAPDDPSWDMYCGTSGWLRYKLKNAVHFGGHGHRGRRLKMWHLLCGVQQLKRNFLPVDEEFVLRTLLKHKKAMQRPPGPMNSGQLLATIPYGERRFRDSTWTLVTEPLIRDSRRDLLRRKLTPASPDLFVEEVSAKMQKVLAGFRPTLPRMMQPSGSACFEAGRSKGGASRYLKDEHFESCYASTLALGGDGVLLMMDYLPHLGVKSVYGIPYPEISGLLTKTTARLFAYKLYSTEVRKELELPCSLTKDTDDTGPDNINCRVAAVKEPGKVRTVTAGEALPYWLSRSFQKDIHAYIRKIPQFSLCGQPLERWHLKFLDRLSSEYGCFQGFTFDGERTVWVSGDYSGATDEIDIRLTRACHGLMMDRLCVSFSEQGLPAEQIAQYVSVLNACIEPHVVSYPKNYVETVEGSDQDLSPCTQLNGQLMGSTLSFPILCIVNFCVGWLAICPHVEDFTKVPILVNGDDILFRCRESQYSVWCDHIKNAGFRRSIGKNFAHEDKIFINSQPWVARPRSDFAESKLCEFDYVPFFNTGLMHGQSKVAKRAPVENEESSKFQPLYSLQPEAVEGALDLERAVRRFHTVNREHLSFASNGGFFSHHAPREFYGLGMVPTKNATFTPFQTRVAKAVVQSGLELSSQGKLFMGDGTCYKSRHDLSRQQMRLGMYRGEIVPPSVMRPSATGYTVLCAKEHEELGLSEDIVSDGEAMMLCNATALARRLKKWLRQFSNDELACRQFSDEYMMLGFKQRRLSEDPIFDVLQISDN